jgi:hypothetical protein
VKERKERKLLRLGFPAVGISKKQYPSKRKAHAMETTTKTADREIQVALDEFSTEFRSANFHEHILPDGTRFFSKNRGRREDTAVITVEKSEAGLIFKLSLIAGNKPYASPDIQVASPAEALAAAQELIKNPNW